MHASFHAQAEKLNLAANKVGSTLTSFGKSVLQRMQRTTDAAAASAAELPAEPGPAHPRLSGNGASASGAEGVSPSFLSLPAPQSALGMSCGHWEAKCLARPASLCTAASCDGGPGLIHSA